ncbi:hypothetical protein [Nocardia acidivorans]|uniref:hypothetical protein n=1 Tax=Nocardia acidivorans TaxID=404580 RepID=UPI00082FFD5F|nr:hypothetical protein [Nocardia acidivorans]
MSEWVTAARAQSGWWIAGLILFVQGFGSALTEALWQHSFGVAAVLRAAGVPEWADWVIGVLGCTLLIVAGLKTRAQAGERA